MNLLIGWIIVRRLSCWIKKLFTDLIILKMGKQKNTFLALILILASIVVSCSTVISTIFDIKTWQEAHEINNNFRSTYFKPNSQQPLVVLTGVRQADTNDRFEKNIAVTPGDIVEVSTTVRNVSGKPLDINVRGNLDVDDVLEYVDGSILVYDTKNEGVSVSSVKMTEQFSIGIFGIYSGIKEPNSNAYYGEANIYYEVRVPNVTDTAISGVNTLHMGTQFTGYDEAGQIATDTIMYDVSVTVDFGE